MNILKLLFNKSILLNLVIIVVVFFAVIFSVNIILDYKTLHGETIEVPDLKGKTLGEVESVLTSNNLRYTVLDSSSYTSKFPKKSVLRQEPEAGSYVKDNRMIYLTINPSGFRIISMPQVVDRPHREAISALISAGLKFGNFQFKVGKYRAENMVVEARYKGENIVAGEKFPRMSTVDLVLDYGKNKNTLIPNLIGDKIDVVKSKLIDVTLNLGSVKYDEGDSEDRTNYFVYKQSPEYKEGSKVSKGRRVNIWLTNDESKLPVVEEDEEEIVE